MLNIKNSNCTRRAFLKAAGIAGAGAVIAPFRQPASASGETGEMPVRPFGSSGINVPILSFGGSLDTSLSMLVLRQAFKWGVTYWIPLIAIWAAEVKKASANILLNIPRIAPGYFW